LSQLLEMVNKLAIYISDADVRLVPAFKEKEQDVSFQPSQPSAKDQSRPAATTLCARENASKDQIDLSDGERAETYV
jgi:hypothetical protein